MGMNYKTVGGGAATSLGNDFASWLQNGLNTGTFGTGSATGQFAGANPVGSTLGISGILNDILSGGAGKVGGALQQLIKTQQNNDVEGIRARFGVGGGTAFGTPGQYAESTYRANAAPQITNAIGQLQLGALSSLLPIFNSISQKGIPQAETVASPSGLTTALGIAAPVIGGILGGPLGTSIGHSLFGSPAAPSANMSPLNMDFGSMFQLPGTTGSMFNPGYTYATPQASPFVPTFQFQ